ncbi:MAG TPA: hypothetical protein VFU81_04605 [Thermomicrobiales bacterium]|nr:hypothetical protein [Thermomicrobiales bacterium]
MNAIGAAATARTPATGQEASSWRCATALTRATTFVLTAIAVARFVLLCAACGGAFLNFNDERAGAASGNPILLMVGVLQAPARRIAGHWRLDRWLAPAVDVPWRLIRVAQPVATDRGAATSGRAEWTGSAATHTE